MADSELTAEFNRLKKGDHGGTVAGVTGVFRERTLDERGQPKTGLTLDEMLDWLRQDARFQWLESTDDLIDAIVYASRYAIPVDVFPGTAELKESLGIDTATAWWADSWQAPQEQATISETSEAAPAETDASSPPRAQRGIGGAA